MKIYIVAWETTDGGGFEWRQNEQEAQQLYEKLKAEIGADCFSKIAFLPHTTESADSYAITNEVDAYLWNNSWELVTRNGASE